MGFLESVNFFTPFDDQSVCEAPRPQGGASREGNFVIIVPLDPAYRAGLAWHLPVNMKPVMDFPPQQKHRVRV